MSTTSTHRYFSKNGELLPFSRATIPLEHIGYQYGFGVYETLKVRKKILYFTEQHVSRLMKSASIIHLMHPFSPEQITTYIEKLIKKSDIENANIKILLIGGPTPEDALLYILPLAPFYPDKKLYSRGAQVDCIHYERFLPNAKTLNMLPSYLYYATAKSHGFYDMLYLDASDHILEGSRTNFFGIKGKTLTTPPESCVLAGVTRQTVMTTARKNGYKVRETRISLRDLRDFDGAFLTSTSSNIIPLTRIGTLSFSVIPEEVRRLMALYKTFLDESNGIFRE